MSIDTKQRAQIKAIYFAKWVSENKKDDELSSTPLNNVWDAANLVYFEKRVFRKMWSAGIKSGEISEILSVINKQEDVYAKEREKQLEGVHSIKQFEQRKKDRELLKEMGII